MVLYELLTGSLPHDLRDRSIPEAALTIRDATPELLGSFDPSFRGDVETPVAKSLEKDRERRYASASELAADIRRYLDGQPIQARPATTLYQLRKFATRHPALVGGLLATGAALLAGIGATSWQAYRATQAEAEMRVERGAALESSRLASQARQRADEVASFLLWGFGLDDANGSADGTLTILDMLALSTERMGEFYAGRPEAEANARRVVGDTYFMLGLNEQAVEQLTLACELSRGRPDMERVLHQNLLVLNMAEREAGHGELAAQRWIGEAVMVGRRILSERHPELEREVAEMTGALLIPTRPREQEICAQLEDVLAALARAMPADHPDAYYVGSFLCLVSTYLGNTFGISTGRFRLQESAVAILRRLVPADPAQASYSQRHALVVYLWMLVRSQAPDGEEEPRVARARELHDLLQWFTGTPWLAVDIPGVLGDALLQRGFADDLPEAERLVLESCADVQRLLGERNIRSVIALERVARMYRNLNREEELLRTLQVVMSALKSCLDAEDLPREATGVAALDQLAWIVARQPGLRPEDYDLARVGAARAAQLEPTSWAFATIHGVALLRAGQPARALEVLRESDALLAGLPVTWACIAMAHEVLGEHEHALAALTHLRALPAVVEGALDEEDRLLLLEAERVVGAR